MKVYCVFLWNRTRIFDDSPRGCGTRSRTNATDLSPYVNAVLKTHESEFFVERAERNRYCFRGSHHRVDRVRFLTI